MHRKKRYPAALTLSAVYDCIKQDPDARRDWPSDRDKFIQAKINAEGAPVHESMESLNLHISTRQFVVGENPAKDFIPEEATCFAEIEDLIARIELFIKLLLVCPG